MSESEASSTSGDADEAADPDLRLARARRRLDRKGASGGVSRIAGQRERDPTRPGGAAGERGAHDLSRGSCRT